MDNVWWRRFARGDQSNQDFIADNAFLKDNFVDHFGHLLQKVELNAFLTFDQVIRTFWDNADYDLQIFCVADGGNRTLFFFFPKMAWLTDRLVDIVYNNSMSAWFDPGVRFAVVVTPKDVYPFKDNNWIIFIVGSAEFDSKERFLQVASWDGHAFRFYSV